MKFVEQHGDVSDATAAFVRFAMAAGAALPFADFREKEVLFAGEQNKFACCALILVKFYSIFVSGACGGPVRERVLTI